MKPGVSAVLDSAVLDEVELLRGADRGTVHDQRAGVKAKDPTFDRTEIHSTNIHSGGDTHFADPEVGYSRLQPVTDRAGSASRWSRRSTTLISGPVIMVVTRAMITIIE
jgi:hypothetical protein